MSVVTTPVTVCDLHAFMNDLSAVHRIVLDVTTRSGGAAAILVRGANGHSFMPRGCKRLMAGGIAARNEKLFNSGNAGRGTMTGEAVSIPSNVAEGHCTSTKELLHHLAHSRGSLHELMTLGAIAQRRRYAPSDMLERITERADREGKLLFALRRSLMPR